MKRKTKRTRVNRAARHAGRLAHLRSKAEAKEVFLEERNVRRAINSDLAHASAEEVANRLVIYDEY